MYHVFVLGQFVSKLFLKYCTKLAKNVNISIRLKKVNNWPMIQRVQCQNWLSSIQAFFDRFETQFQTVKVQLEGKK